MKLHSKKQCQQCLETGVGEGALMKDVKAGHGHSVGTAKGGKDSQCSTPEVIGNG